MKSVAMMHYASSPTVGGVESTIDHHARGLSRLGYVVRVITGSGASLNDDEGITVYEHPLFGSRDPKVLFVKKQLDQGLVSADFWLLVAEIQAALKECLAGIDLCIVHNIPTLNKNLPLTAALAQHSADCGLRLIAWCHDLAWTNPQYLPELHPGQPWELLKTPWPDVAYVTVSEPRRHELAALFSIAPNEVEVVLPGVDPAAFYQWTPTTRLLAERLRLLDADALLLLPARLTRRKNIALGLRVLADLRRQSGADYRLIVTGPPGPHNPQNMGYLGELLDLQRELGLVEAAHFLYAYGEGEQPLIPDNPTMANLYHLADALFFPSTQEGFGIPMLEAAFAGLPVFCADIPPLRSTGQADAYYFDPNHTPSQHIAQNIYQKLSESGRHRLRVRVRQTYRWERIIQDKLVPLVEKGHRKVNENA